MELVSKQNQQVTNRRAKCFYPKGQRNCLRNYVNYKKPLTINKTGFLYWMIESVLQISILYWII